MRDNEPLSSLSSYCGKPHRIVDGLPLAHACRVLPPDAVQAELWGDQPQAVRIFAARAAGGQLSQHAGVWKVRRRR